jgi:nitrogen regulatory protein PII
LEARIVVKVEAIIREDSLEAVVARLLMIHIHGLTVFAVKGAARGDAHRAVFRGSSYSVPFISKLLLEWYGPDDEADAVVRAIRRAAFTGAPGDGKIFVERVLEAVRIRTGERGLDAI